MANMEELTKIKDKAEEAVDMEQVIKDVGTTTVKLSKPFEYEGTVYQELAMNFEDLTGAQLEAIDDELMGMLTIVMTPTGSRKYQRLLAAKAAGVPSDMIEHLPARDYMAVVNAARRFLSATA